MLPKSTSSIWDDSLSIHVFHRCRYINLCVELYSTASEVAGRNFPFSSLFTRLLVFCFGFGPTSACRSPEGICSLLTQDGVKGAADSGALAHSGRGEGGVWMLGELEAAEASMTLQQPEACHVFSWGSCPWITGPWWWCVAQALRRGGVESDLYSHTRLGGSSSSLSISCLSLWSALIDAAHSHLWSSFRWLSEFHLLSHQETKRQEKVSCLFGSSRPFPGLPPG